MDGEKLERSSKRSVKVLMEVADGSHVVVEARALYTSISEAASIAGVARETMTEWANTMVNPIPHIQCGRAKKLIRVSAIPGYAQEKERV